MGIRLCLVSLLSVLTLSGCQVYADANRGLARAVNPDVRAAEALTAQQRHNAVPQECLCPPLPRKSLP